MANLMELEDFIPPEGQCLVYVYKHEFAIWTNLRDEGEIVHLQKWNSVTLDWEDAGPVNWLRVDVTISQLHNMNMYTMGQLFIRGRLMEWISALQLALACRKAQMLFEQFRGRRITADPDIPESFTHIL